MALMVKEKKRKLAFTFSIGGALGKNTLFAKDSVNCDCRGGKLQTRLGSEPILKADGGAQACGVENAQRLILLKAYDSTTKTYTERFGVLTQGGEFYAQEEKDGEFVRIATGLEHAGVTQFAGEDSRYVLALIGEDACVYFRDDGTFDVAVFEGTARAGCFFRHRVFIGIKPSSLACSAPERELDFAESVHDGGLLRFPAAGGSIVGMKAFKDRLYLFFEHGIVKLNAAGALKNFTAEEISYAGGKIYGKTLCLGTNGVYFMTSDGVYCFDGDKAERLFTDSVLLPKEETLLESSAVFSDRVLLRYLTETGYKTLVLYEDKRNCYYVDTLPAFSDEEGGRCLFTNENGVIYRLMEGGENCFAGEFFSTKTDLGLAGRKTLTKLCFEGEGSFTLTIKTGGRSFMRDVFFQDGVAEVKLSERGEHFTFDFSLKGGTTISAMTAEVKTAA